MDNYIEVTGEMEEKETESYSRNRFRDKNSRPHQKRNVKISLKKEVPVEGFFKIKLIEVRGAPLRRHAPPAIVFIFEGTCNGLKFSVRQVCEFSAEKAWLISRMGELLECDLPDEITLDEVTSIFQDCEGMECSVNVRPIYAQNDEFIFNTLDLLNNVEPHNEDEGGN